MVIFHSWIEVVVTQKQQQCDDVLGVSLLWLIKNIRLWVVWHLCCVVAKIKLEEPSLSCSVITFFAEIPRYLEIEIYLFF